MDTDSYCVKTQGKCSEVRCNICPRFTYSKYGVPMYLTTAGGAVPSETKPAYPLDAPQPRCAQEAWDYYLNMEPDQPDLFDGTLAEDRVAQDQRAVEESLEQWAERVIAEAPVPKADAVVKPNHYARYKIEPINFIMRNDLPFWMGNVVKYVMRADAKDGIQDLKKAIRYIEFRIRELEGEIDITARD